MSKKSTAYSGNALEVSTVGETGGNPVDGTATNAADGIRSIDASPPSSEKQVNASVANNKDPLPTGQTQKNTVNVDKTPRIPRSMSGATRSATFEENGIASVCCVKSAIIDIWCSAMVAKGGSTSYV